MGEAKLKRDAAEAPLTNEERKELVNDLGSLAAKLAGEPQVREIETSVIAIEDHGQRVIMLDIAGKPFRIPSSQWCQWAKNPDEPLGYVMPHIGMAVLLTGFENNGLRRFKISRI